MDFCLLCFLLPQTEQWAFLVNLLVGGHSSIYSLEVTQNYSMTMETEDLYRHRDPNFHDFQNGEDFHFLWLEPAKRTLFLCSSMHGSHNQLVCPLSMPSSIYLVLVSQSVVSGPSLNVVSFMHSKTCWKQPVVDLCSHVSVSIADRILLIKFTAFLLISLI